MNANQEQRLDEIIFEHRNKEYGAFELRTTYGKTVRKSVIIGVSAFMTLTLTSFIYAKQHDKDEVLKIVEVFIQKIDEPEEPLPPIEEPLPEPERIEQRTVEYEVPQVVLDTDPAIESPPPTLDEIEVAKISTVTKAGPEDDGSIFSAPPAETPAPETTTTELKEDENKIFTTVEINPSFVGGNSEMYKFLGKNLNYPSQAQRANIEGKVFLSFVVEKDGSITDVMVARGIGFGCDEEAARVVKMMPKWMAGKQNGNPVRVKFTIPVFYKLQ